MILGHVPSSSCLRRRPSSSGFQDLRERRPELGDGLENGIHLDRLQLGKHRQAQTLLGTAFSSGKRATPKTKILVARLQVQGHRIMQARADVLLFEEVLKI